MSENELRVLGELGFDHWLDNKPNYKEDMAERLFV